MSAALTRWRVGLVWMLVAALLPLSVRPAAALGSDIVGPSGSGRFGTHVVVLPNGNLVVTDPSYSTATASKVGAVYLYEGETWALISALTGSTPSDQVGSAGITVLSNGNFVISSPNWDNGIAVNAGAVTWVDGATGLSGAVSIENSLVGSQASDQVGSPGVSALTNGNYVVRSQFWDRGTTQNVGAITWGDGTTGITGTVSLENSLVGSAQDDGVGNPSLTVLPSGNYVVSSPNWDNGAVNAAGAVTWGDGTKPLTGVVSADNSLVGSSPTDIVGNGSLTVLSNGNYVVASPFWDNGAAGDAGAITWADGTTGITGTVSAENSLVGGHANTRLSHPTIRSVLALTNGNYVVSTAFWNDGQSLNLGAVTWGDGTTGITGTVSSENSLVGATGGDAIGWFGLYGLSNGNYVICSQQWNNGAVADAGAVTWSSGTRGITGTISASNSLVGTSANDKLCDGGIEELSNGHYVIISSAWNNGDVVDAGAATWVDGTQGITGTISASNSLVGSSTSDYVAGYGVHALTNGNYVVASPFWDHAGIVDAGAATWADGTTGITGTVTAANSLIGAAAGNQVASGGIYALTDGNYVVGSELWGLGQVADVGAITWVNGTTATTGTVTAANSLIGTTAGDEVGDYIIALSAGSYVVLSPIWDNGSAVDAGALTWGPAATVLTGTVTAANSIVGVATEDYVGADDIIALPDGRYLAHNGDWDNGTIVDAGAVTLGGPGVVGPISAANSVLGTTAGQAYNITIVYDEAAGIAFIGRPYDTVVSVLELSGGDAQQQIFLPLVRR